MLRKTKHQFLTFFSAKTHFVSYQNFEKAVNILNARADGRRAIDLQTLLFSVQRA